MPNDGKLFNAKLKITQKYKKKYQMYAEQFNHNSSI